MDEDVLFMMGWVKINAEAWVSRRVGDVEQEHTRSLNSFISWAEHGDYSYLMHRWCADQGWSVPDGGPLRYVNREFMQDVTIVLAAASQQRYALVQVDDDPPTVYLDRADDAAWRQVWAVRITCPPASRRIPRPADPAPSRRCRTTARHRIGGCR